MSFGIAGVTPAAAYHLVPENTDFTGTGKTSATKNGSSLPCKANFTGKADTDKLIVCGTGMQDRKVKAAV